MREFATKFGAVRMRSYSSAERKRDEQEAAWLVAKRDQFVGVRIALEGDELLAAALSAREVFAAVAGRATTPLVMPIEATGPTT